MNITYKHLEYQMIERPDMVVVSHVETTYLSFKQRWLSWPWNPFKFTVEKTIFRPSTQILVFEADKSLAAHPATLEELRRHLVLLARQEYRERHPNVHHFTVGPIAPLTPAVENRKFNFTDEW